MNDYQKDRFVQRMMDAMFNTVSDKKIAILGFAFKKDTNDVRESPAIAVCTRLLEENACLKIFDPQVSDESILTALGLKENDRRISFHDNAADATKSTHAIAILTEWEEFKNLNFDKIYAQMEKPAYLFDGRNLIDSEIVKSAGFRVYRIGKE
jgi:UDPglucose 6-dehydrogenase